MGKHLQVGIYIGSSDSDIAAWFNMLRKNKLSRTRWIKGLLAAYALDKPLNIGTITFSALSTVQQISASRASYKCGWHIKGTCGEFIYGSIINITIGKSAVAPILEQVLKNNHSVSAFAKALIRENLKMGDQEISPNTYDLNQLYSSFLIQQSHKLLNHHSIHPHSELNSPVSLLRSNSSTPISVPQSPIIEPIGIVPESASTQKTTPAFNFGAEPESKIKNPLMNYI